MTQALASASEKFGELARRQPRITIGALGLTGILIVEFVAMVLVRHPFT